MEVIAHFYTTIILTLWKSVLLPINWRFCVTLGRVGTFGGEEKFALTWVQKTMFITQYQQPNISVFLSDCEQTK